MGNSPVLIIDSGSGGISIWKCVVKILPYEPIIYFGDHAYVPYGNRSRDFIRRRIIKIIKAQKTPLKLIIIACNTATVAGIAYYRSVFPDIAVIGVVPVVKTAAVSTRSGSFLILSTSFTSKSLYQKKLVAEFAGGLDVINLECDGLVRLIESGNTDPVQIRSRLKPAVRLISSKKIDTVVLGCTHFPLIKNSIKQVLGDNVTILDSGQAVARHAKRILSKNNTLSKSGHPSYTFITTGNNIVVEKRISGFLKKPVHFLKSEI